MFNRLFLAKLISAGYTEDVYGKKTYLHTVLLLPINKAVHIKQDFPYRANGKYCPHEKVIVSRKLGWTGFKYIILGAEDELDIVDRNLII